MATRPYVPRADGESSIGVAGKKWGKIYAYDIDEKTNLGNNKSLGYRQPSDAQTVGDVRYHATLPTGWYLECTTAGTTGGGDITLPSPIAEKDTVTDGTVVWTIRKLTTVEIPNASSTVAGIMKLYSSKGTNTDGAMTQQAITNELGSLRSLIGTGGGIIAENLANNGYIKFANGLIVQWGSVNPAQFPSNGQPVTFPIAFTSTPKVMGMINQNTNSTSESDLITNSLNIYATTSSMIAHIYDGVSNTKLKFDWIAIGY